MGPPEPRDPRNPAKKRKQADEATPNDATASNQLETLTSTAAFNQPVAPSTSKAASTTSAARSTSKEASRAPPVTPATSAAASNTPTHSSTVFDALGDIGRALRPYMEELERLRVRGSLIRVIEERSPAMRLYLNHNIGPSDYMLSREPTNNNDEDEEDDEDDDEEYEEIVE